MKNLNKINVFKWELSPRKWALSRFLSVKSFKEKFFHKIKKKKNTPCISTQRNSFSVFPETVPFLFCVRHFVFSRRGSHLESSHRADVYKNRHHL